MARAHPRILQSLRHERTAEVDVEFHCRSCKGYHSRNLDRRAVATLSCRCGSTNLLLLGVGPEPSAPLLRRDGERHGDAEEALP